MDRQYSSIHDELQSPNTIQDLEHVRMQPPEFVGIEDVGPALTRVRAPDHAVHEVEARPPLPAGVQNPISTWTALSHTHIFTIRTCTHPYTYTHDHHVWVCTCVLVCAHVCWLVCACVIQCSPRANGDMVALQKNHSTTTMQQHIL
jgi:hypothetical protein